ncbi:MAG: AzlD domain-containing protein [Betaproteobacteria bacterium]|jgi:branched-subunit amino acid transport protein
MNLNWPDYLLLILLMTLGTVFTRSFFFMVGGARRMPDWLQRSLSHVPAVALSAIIAPDLLMVQGALVEPWLNIKLISALVATLFFLITRHMLGTLLIGMLCFTALRLWF